jgi:squalene synthase HpnC
MGPTRADAEGETAGSEWAARGGGDIDRYLRDRETAENFPVALRVLPRAVRSHLSAVYDVTRVIDDLGDEAPGDRVALLTAFRADLEGIWDGAQPSAPVLRRLAATVAACGLSRQPFDDLVAANLKDQTVATYPTYADLVGYCALSADPVGRIVLEVFGASTPERVTLSDRICTGLQIIEHCQDVAEDRRAGRIYLPLDDLAAYGVSPADLDAPADTPALRRLVAFEAERALGLLDEGLPLVGQLRGWARIAVAGYVAGGRAAVRAMRRGRWSVVPVHPPVRRGDVVRELVAVLRQRGAVA